MGVSISECAGRGRAQGSGVHCVLSLLLVTIQLEPGREDSCKQHTHTHTHTHKVTLSPTHPSSSESLLQTDSVHAIWYKIVTKSDCDRLYISI